MNNLDSLTEEIIDNIRLRKQQKRIDIMNKLLNKLSECQVFDVNASFDDGKTSLTEAAGYGFLDDVKFLIEILHADPNIQDKCGWTALHYASSLSQYKMIDYLISVPGIDVNTKTTYGNTALHRAALRGKKLSVKVLLRSNGLDTSLHNCKGETAEEIARRKGYHDIADMIAAAAYKPPHDELTKPAHTYCE